MITAIAKAVDCVDNHEMIQRAWNYMNDGLRTDIFMRYSPETIAVACIFLSSRVLKVRKNVFFEVFIVMSEMYTLQVPLPMTPSPWWILFNAEQGDIWEIAIILLRMYERQTPLSWSRVDREINVLRQVSFLVIVCFLLIPRFLPYFGIMVQHSCYCRSTKMHKWQSRKQ